MNKIVRQCARILVCFIAVTIIGCDSGGGSPEPTTTPVSQISPTPTPSPTQSATPTPTPTPSGVPDANLDSDKDGVPDSDDQCADTPAGNAVDANGCDIGRNVLVFSKTTGFRHQSIAAGKALLQKLADKNAWQVSFTENGGDFTASNLAKFDVVVWLNTTGDPLNEQQQDAFEDYINGGGGYVGVHAAADTEFDWPFYGDLVGAYFKSHPQVQDATLTVEDSEHASSQHLDAGTWQHRDEWYNFRMNPRADVTVVLSLDESTYSPGADAMTDHPISWYHEVGKGRSFYTGLGHTDEAYTGSTNFEKHLEGGIAWAGSITNAVPVWTGSPPSELDFEAVALAKDIHLPVALDMSVEGDIYIIGRAGDFYAFENDTLINKTTIATQNFDEQQEGGLIGFALDPNFSDNRFAYFHYTHPTEDKNRVTRMRIDQNNALDLSSEVELLNYAVQLSQCCHQAGALAFDTLGNLLIATGDNTNPFVSSGYAPLDERNGRSPWDAQKSSSNTNDLRGKILRITPSADGSYTIPTGNLFPGDNLHRPEIYVMGNRNPYRMAIDSETNQLFWGDIGPDAGGANANRGPAGYDEINRTLEAGNFGWPYFAGKNEAYNDFTYDGVTNTSGTSGNKFDSSNVVNNSPNNTGAQTLPNARGAWVTLGHRATMVGDVYRWNATVTDNFKLPSYFHGKLIYWNFNNDKLFEAAVDEDTPMLRQWFGDINAKGLIDARISPKNNRLYMVTYGGNCCKSPPDRGALVELRYVGTPGVVAERTDYAINAGGGNFNAADGVSYEADRYFSAGNEFTQENPVEGTSDDALYSRHRWFNDDFSYDFPIKNGKYSVSLLFAETFFKNPGDRVFSVAIEDNPVLTDFDIVGQVGASTALERRFDVSVTDGILNINFKKITQNPIVSAILISEKANIPPGSVIGIRADINDKFVVPTSSREALAASDTLGNKSSYEVRPGINGGISLYSYAVSKYLRVVNDANALIKVDSDTVTLAETFTFEKRGNIHGLISSMNGKYVVAEKAGADPLRANRNALGIWEAFRIELSDYCDPLLSADRAIPCRPKASAYMAFPNSSAPDLSNIPKLLSETGAFKDVSAMTVADNLIPYDLVSPLWSDRAVKRRWVSIPTGSRVTYREDGTWSWPAGTVFIKHFDLPIDEQNTSTLRRLETRFVIVKEDLSIYAVSYKWREDQQEADLLFEGEDENYTIAKGSETWEQTWSYPSPSDCLECHNEDVKGVLGPKTASLNGNYAYPSGITENQLSTWNHMRLFDNRIDEADLSSLPRHAHISDNNASLELRVRSYWDINCGFCHGPKGIAANWDARFEVPLVNQGVINGGVADQRDYFADYGLAAPVIVDPKNKSNSILYIRDKSVGEDKMPPLAKNLEDKEYIRVLEEWINSLN